MSTFTQMIKSWFIPQKSNPAATASEVEQSDQSEIPYPKVRIRGQSGNHFHVQINDRLVFVTILPGDSVERAVDKVVNDWFEAEKERRRLNEEIARVQRELNERAGDA